VRKFFRTTYSVAVILLFLAVAVLGFTQTKVFHSYLRNELIETIARQFHGELSLGSVQGNLFTGFQVDDVILRLNGEPIMTVKRLEAKYDPLGALTKSLSVSRITLNSPVIYLTRSQAGTWNVEQLLRPSPGQSGPSSWTINLKQLQIKSGAVQLIDSLTLARRAADSSLQISPGRIDYADIALDSLELDAGLTVRSRQVGLTLRSFACRSPHPDVHIKTFTGDFLLAPTFVSVRKLTLVTSRSHLKLDARLDSADITRLSDLAQLEFAPVSARLDVERLDFGELKQFIGRPVKFLEKEVAGQIVVEGRFGLMDVRNVTLHAGTTVVRISGTLANLHSPSNLELDLACIRNRIDPDDVRRLMPSLEIPDLSSIGAVDYDLRFKGKPTAFDARLSSSTRVGKIDFDGTLDFREEPLSFNGTVKTSRLNLAPIVGDSSFTSSLNATISLQGRGTKLSEMTCVARAEMDSSRFYGLPIVRSVAVLDVAERTMRPRISMRAGSSRIDLGGTIRMRPQDGVVYDLSGRINSFNLADVTKKNEHNSDISFDLQAAGEIKSTAELSTNLNLNFFRSSFDTVKFAGGPATIRINTLADEPHTLSVASDIFDLDVEGSFTPVTVASALGRGAGLLAEAIQSRVNSLDTVRSEMPGQQPVREFHLAVTPRHDSTEYKFILNVKDCFPIGVVLGREIDGRLTANGHLKDGSGGAQFDGTVQIQDLRYADNSLGFSIDGGSISYNVDGLSQARLLQSMAISLGVRATRFDIAGLRTANLSVDVTSRGDSGKFQIEAQLDSIVTVRARGTSAYANRQLRLDVDHMQADFNSYVFESPAPIRCTVGHDGLNVANLLMRHETEEVSASGYFVPSGISNLAVSGHNVLINNLVKVIRRSASSESLPVMSGTVNVKATFNGSFQEPRFSAELDASGVRYEERNFGNVQIRTSYAHRVLNVFAQLLSRPDSASAQPELLINGTVPYNLSLTGGPEQKLEGEMNLDVYSNSFRLEFLDPFIPELNNLTGLLICNMKLRGSVESPSYDGSVVLQNARFMFNPLGIEYIVDGKLVPNGKNIAFDGVTVRNVPADQPDGKVTISGSFALEGLKIKEFDLAANGQLLVMKESVRRSSSALYGDLFAGTGPEGVRWNGVPSRSSVSGAILVKSANLTLPPTTQTQDLPNSGIEVRFINDRVDSTAIARVGNESKSPIPSSRSKKPAAVMQDVPAPLSKSFLDYIAYNLSIETQGVTQLRFVFSKFTNEQLLAELKGRTAFTKDGDQIRLTGELELGNRSYYNNFKKLAATGTLKFTGDPVNPELDIVASYEGIHRGVDTSGYVSAGGSRLSSGSERVIVKVYITGTRELPLVRMGLERYDQLGNLIRQDRADVEGDAIAFLVTGTFRDDLTQQDRVSLAGSSVLGGVASSILSGPLTDLLRKEFGIVRSVDVLYYGGGSFQESADVRLTGEVGDAVFRLGGKVLSDLNNTNVSVQLPMSAIVGSEKWRNLLLEAERTVQGVESFDQRRESKGLRLLYRIIF
jgi:autotransporter translocation and assembly factor TamB